MHSGGMAETFLAIWIRVLRKERVEGNGERGEDMLISRFSAEDSAARVAEMEAKYGVMLPSEYRAFLCKYNGGFTPKTRFKIGRAASDLRGFFGGGSAKLNFENVHMEGWLAGKLFPIACDSFGNYVAISLREESYGKICFYDHETENKISVICESFTDFLGHCRSDLISDASRRSVAEREAVLTAAGKGDRITDVLRRMWQAEVERYAHLTQERVVLE